MKTSVVAKNTTTDYINHMNVGMYKICTDQETELLLC